MEKTFNPCDECGHSFSKQNQESGMCENCEYKKLLRLEQQGKFKFSDTGKTVFLNREEAEEKLKAAENHGSF